MWYITSSHQRESSQCYYWWLFAGTNAAPICSSDNMHWHCQLNSSLPSSSFCHYISICLSHVQVRKDQKALFNTLIGIPTCLWGTKGSIRKFFRIPLALAICRQKTRQTPINKYLSNIHIYDSTRQTSRINTTLKSIPPNHLSTVFPGEPDCSLHQGPRNCLAQLSCYPKPNCLGSKDTATVGTPAPEGTAK